MAKICLITGASKGIGRSTALVLAREGYNLILCSRNLSTLEELHSEISALNPECIVHLYALDLSDREQLQTLTDSLDEKAIHTDILINNLGIYQPAKLLEEPDENFLEMMQVNAFVPYFLSKALGRKMAERKAGHIFSIGSVAGKSAVAGAGSYSVSKFALYGLMLNLREELRASGVHVTVLMPGATLTASWEGTKIDTERFIQPEDIAETISNCLKLSKGANMDEISLSPLNFEGTA